MTTQAQALQAGALINELNQVNAAIAALASAGNYSAAYAEITIQGAASMRFQISPSVAQVNTFLTNRQAALQSAIAALGIVG